MSSLGQWTPVLHQVLHQWLLCMPLRKGFLQGHLTGLSPQSGKAGTACSPATAPPGSSILAHPGQLVYLLLVPPPKRSRELLALLHSLMEMVQHSKCSPILGRLIVLGSEKNL